MSEPASHRRPPSVRADRDERPGRRTSPPPSPGAATADRSPATLLRGGRDTARASAQVLRLVWSTSRSQTITLAAATIAQSVVPAIQVAIAGALIQSVADGISTTGAARDLAINHLIWLAIAQLAILIGSSLAQTIGNVSQQLLQERMSISIQRSIMAHAATLDLADFENAAYYDQLQRAQQESSHRPMQMVSQIFGLIRAAITFTTLVALLVVLGPLIAIATLLAPIPSFIASSRYGWQGFHMMRRQSPSRRMMSYLTQLLSTDEYAKEIKLYDLGDHFIERFSRLAAAYYRDTRELIVRRYWVGFAWGSLTVLASTGTFLYVAIQAIGGAFTLGQLTVFTGAAAQVQGAFQSLLGGVQGLYEHGLYLSTLDELMTRRPAITTPTAPILMRRPFVEGIEFRHVSYTYPGHDSPALRDVSFTVSPGQTVALVGRNGAGKSTLVKLLTRLYEPTSGQILLDGVDLRDYNVSELRQQFAVMFQDFATYQLSVRENVGAGDIAAHDDTERIELAIERAGAGSVVSRLPAGTDTTLGRWFEGGQQLSGGEWQKIALARAFMRDAATAQILILDEPTAALDARAEADLFARIRALAADRITLMISHRFSTVRDADVILVLENGEITEQGTHHDLVGRGGTYAELFTLQAAGYR